MSLELQNWLGPQSCLTAQAGVHEKLHHLYTYLMVYSSELASQSVGFVKPSHCACG